MKSDFTIDEIGYEDAKSIIVSNHYLGKIYDEFDNENFKMIVAIEEREFEREE